MLTTILRNLVGNAVKYDGADGRVVVGCRRRQGRVAIEVHDDGPGIAPERLASIFDAFDRAGRRDGAGLGLGLHIVRQTAHALGHSISVNSRAGRGSVFSVTATSNGAVRRSMRQATRTARRRHESTAGGTKRVPSSSKA